MHLHFEYWRSGGESAAVDPEELITSVCKVGKDGKGDSLDDAPQASRRAGARSPPPSPTPSRPVADDIAGEVFTNG